MLETIHDTSIESWLSGETSGSAGNLVPEVEFRDRIAAILGAHSLGASGLSLDPVDCPFHDEGQRSARLHLAKGLHLLVCERWYGWGDPCWQVTVASLLRGNRPPSMGLTTEIREALIREGHTNLARLLDVLYSRGLVSGDCFTLQDAVAVCSGLLTKWNVRNAIDSLKRLFCGFFATLLLEKLKGTENRKNTGRPRKIYRLPSLQEIAGIFGLDTFHFDPIPAEKIKRQVDYKAEVYAAFPRRRPGRYPRAVLADRLSISKSTSRTYDRIAGLAVKAQYDERKLQAKECARLPRKLPQKRGYGEWLEDDCGSKYPRIRECAERILKSGSEVHLVKQLMNHYKDGRSNPNWPTGAIQSRVQQEEAAKWQQVDRLVPASWQIPQMGVRRTRGGSYA